MALKRDLASSDPAVRREALEQLEKKHPATAGNDILPLLCSALSDQDEQVRHGAAAVLAMISFSNSPKFQRWKEEMTDLRSYAPLKAALARAFDDPSEETRKNALAAYVLTFDVAPAMQDQLVSRYDSEREFSLFRTAILEALTIDGTPTPAAKALLIRVAGDGSSASVVLAQIVTTDAKAPPADLLPIFVNQFGTAREAPQRQMFARAIGKFGTLAKPYLPSLEQAAAVETDDVTRKNILRAIAAIQGGK